MQQLRYVRLHPLIVCYLPLLPLPFTFMGPVLDRKGVFPSLVYFLLFRPGRRNWGLMNLMLGKQSILIKLRKRNNFMARACWLVECFLWYSWNEKYSLNLNIFRLTFTAAFPGESLIIIVCRKFPYMGSYGLLFPHIPRSGNLKWDFKKCLTQSSEWEA